MGVRGKIRFLGGIHEKPINRGELPKKWGLDRLRRGLAEKEVGGVFEGGGLISQCMLWNIVKRLRF